MSISSLTRLSAEAGQCNLAFTLLGLNDAKLSVKGEKVVDLVSDTRRGVPGPDGTGDDLPAPLCDGVTGSLIEGALVVDGDDSRAR